MKNFQHLFAIAFCFLLLVIGCGKIENTSKNQTNQPVSNEPPIIIKAETLTSEYNENELAADSKYKNKRVEVSGKISEIAEVLGTIQVDLEGHKESGINIVSVKCVFPESEKPAVSKLKKNQITTLIGTVAGKTLNLYVGLDNCKVK